MCSPRDDAVEHERVALRELLRGLAVVKMPIAPSRSGSPKGPDIRRVPRQWKSCMWSGAEKWSGAFARTSGDDS